MYLVVTSYSDGADGQAKCFGDMEEAVTEVYAAFVGHGSHADAPWAKSHFFKVAFDSINKLSPVDEGGCESFVYEASGPGVGSPYMLAKVFKISKE